MKFCILKKTDTVLTNFPYSPNRKVTKVCGKLIATKFAFRDTA